MRIILFLFFFFSGSITSPAYAIQLHGAPEGMYVHQLGHLLYIVAMLGFAYGIRISKLFVIKGWMIISVGAFLLAAWNLWAFYAHIIDTLIPRDHFIANNKGIFSAIVIHSRLDYLYYLFKMDHLLCVPAMLCMYIGLRKLSSKDKSVNDKTRIT